MNQITQKVNIFTYMYFYFLLFNFAQFLFCPTIECCDSAYENFVDKALAVWTRLDLIRATDSNKEYKQLICQELMDEVLGLYCYSNRSRLNFNVDQKEEVIELLAQIERTFSEVFGDIELPETTTSCTVLKRIRYSLKEPASVEAKCSA